MTETAIDSTAVEIGTELEPAAPAAPPASLFRTDDPVAVLVEAKRIADALAPVIRGAKLVSNINGKDYLNVEAWQTLGQQLGVTGVIVSTTQIDQGWEATCEARTLDGRTIGSADSMCTRDEIVKGTKRWEKANEFEVRSMAQTRAMSRALASVLRFIPTLAGMGGTPAEEMDRVKAEGGGGSSTGFASDKQRKFFERKLSGLGVDTVGAERVSEYLLSRPGADVREAVDAVAGDDVDAAEAMKARLITAANLYAEKTAAEVNGTEGFEEPAGEDSPV